MELPDLDPVIHQRTRLRILTLLHRNREAGLSWVRKTLDLTYGNLDSHASRLEEAGFVTRRRRLTSDGFEVRLAITKEGDEAFAEYRDSLRAYIAQAPPGEQPAREPPSSS